MVRITEVIYSSIDSQPILSKMQNEFLDFVNKQEKTCKKRHYRWRTLPEHLIEQIPDYLETHEHLKATSLIHVDISCDHVFGQFDSNDEHWHITGLIDFGDALVGDPVYEFVALHCTLSDLDKNLLSTVLKAYRTYEKPFVERAMIAMLLFEFNVFKNVIEHRSEDFSKVATLEELAESIWTIDDM
ncbi:hypothetical protein I4U23_029704 [Adineta vaga]|nr:hypothetical protein I4U23_029704 [Adineta vaga]